jgi:hypothetical protein
MESKMTTFKKLLLGAVAAIAMISAVPSANAQVVIRVGHRHHYHHHYYYRHGHRYWR